jgi:hypothetical protein
MTNARKDKHGPNTRAKAKKQALEIEKPLHIYKSRESMEEKEGKTDESDYQKIKQLLTQSQAYLAVPTNKTTQ